MRLSYAIVEVFFWKLSSKKTRLTFIQFITTSKKIIMVINPITENPDGKLIINELYTTSI